MITEWIRNNLQGKIDDSKVKFVNDEQFGKVLSLSADSKAFVSIPADGLLGGISNITEDGFGLASFHSCPESLRIDYLSGDYISGFFGYAVDTTTYVTNEKEYCW